MAAADAAEWFSKGIEALGHDHVYLARTCFEHATKEERTPRSCSYLALCQAKTRGKFDDAIDLAREAIAAEPGNSLHYLNLGRVFLLAGMKGEAIEVFREGLKRERNAEVVTELERLGTRKAPPLPSLHRNHPLNKYLGILLARLGLR
jgi:tetratricopeptide (TPR) repeat protein